MSQEREKGSGYVEFSDKDPVDGAVLVRVHKIKTAVSLEQSIGIRGPAL